MMDLKLVQFSRNETGHDAVKGFQRSFILKTEKHTFSLFLPDSKSGLIKYTVKTITIAYLTRVESNLY